MPARSRDTCRDVSAVDARARALEAALPVYGLGRPFHAERTLPSTNDWLRARAAAGAPEGAAVMAWEQTRGRGRQGRAWHSPPGLGLYLSVLLRPTWPARDAVWLAALGALAVGDALREAGVGAAGIKPPNDVLVDGRKIAGILAEPRLGGGRIEFAVLGIGLNVGQATADWRGTPVEGRAISCREAGLDWTPDLAALRVLTALGARYRPLCTTGPARLADDWEAAGGRSPPPAMPAAPIPAGRKTRCVPTCS